MREMGWSWEDLLSAPEDVVSRIKELLRERQTRVETMDATGGVASNGR